MPIESHKSLSAEELGTTEPGMVAVGSSNSNSHNAGGGELSRTEMQEVLSQLTRLLPQQESKQPGTGQ